MRQIIEYLSNKIVHPIEKYYVILPGNAPYTEISKKYSDERLCQRKLASFEYWVFSSSKLLEILKPFEKGIRINKYLLKIWEVPEEYENCIDRFKTEFENSEEYPESYLKKVDYDDII